MTALLFKIIPAIIVFIFTMGIIDTQRLHGHPFFKGTIALLTAISTLFLSDQIYSLATGEPNIINEIMKDVRGDNDANTPSQSASTVKWNPKIFRGKRSYSYESDLTVRDNFTGLIWQKKSDGIKRNFDEAKRYCEGLPIDGLQWRLPSIEELYYLADVTQEKAPKIDKNYFDIESSWYWTSTPYRDKSDVAWVVYFNDGYDYTYLHTLTLYVLCVSGQ